MIMTNARRRGPQRRLALVVGICLCVPRLAGAQLFGDRAAETPKLKLVIDKLSITGGEVELNTSQLVGRNFSAVLPSIELRDIGKDQGGATPAEVAKRVLAVLSQRITAAVATTQLSSLMKSKLGEAAGKAAVEIDKVIPESAKDRARQLGGLADKLLGK